MLESLGLLADAASPWLQPVADAASVWVQFPVFTRYYQRPDAGCVGHGVCIQFPVFASCPKFQVPEFNVSESTLAASATALSSVYFMPIQVTCPGCLKRFTVNDKYAGKSGPCPSCRKVIKIPDKSDEVVIHAPEPTGPKDSAGRAVLKPIRRKEVALSMPAMIAAGLATFIVFGLALGIRFTGDAPPTALLVIGAILLAPPLVFVGYWFLRDDELDGYSGRELLIRCGVCALAFAGCWLLFAFVPMYVTGEKSMADVPGSFMLFTFPVMIAIGTFVSVGALELEFVQGALHYLLYLAITLILALIMGTKLSDSFSGDASSPGPAVVQPAVPGTPKTPDPAKPAEKPADKPAEPEKPKVNVLQ